MSRLEGVLPENVPVMWGFVADRVEQACAEVPGSDMPLHFFEQCCTRRMQLWLCVRDGSLAGVLITSITGRLCTLEIAQADCLDYALGELGTVIEWARSMGCIELDFHGRAGWTKPFLQAGFRTKTIHMSRAI